MKALVRVKPVYRPISRDIIGLRLQAAIPNNAARRMMAIEGGEFRATKQEVPSFQGHYLIGESMDYSGFSEITASELDRFLARIKFEGFTTIEFFGKQIQQHLEYLTS
jgi:hypothetical protein